MPIIPATIMWCGGLYGLYDGEYLIAGLFLGFSIMFLFLAALLRRTTGRFYFTTDEYFG